MKSCIRIIIILLVILMAGSPTVYPVRADTSPVNEVNSSLLQVTETDDGVAFDVVVPWEQLKLEEVMVDSRTYTRVSLPEWVSTTQPGGPLLPMLTEMIGAPYGAEIEMRVTPGNARTQQLNSQIMPVTTMTVDMNLPEEDEVVFTPAQPVYVIEEDSSVYSTSADYPGELAKFSNDGSVRGQRVVGISVFPIQYNPATMTLTIYETLHIEVSFKNGEIISGTPTKQESEAYENLFSESLLNYDAALDFRLEDAGLPSIQMVTPLEGQIYTPPNPGWRIKVREDGIYKLTYETLLAADAGFGTPSVNTLQLFNMGQEVAREVVDTNANGAFGPTDYILFFGQGIESKYTKENIYWLTHGSATGQTMGTRDGTSGTEAVPPYYPARKFEEKKLSYNQWIVGNDNVERFYWNNLSRTKTWTYSFTLLEPYTAGAPNASLTINLVGYNNDTKYNPDHKVEVKLNNTVIGTTQWEGIAWKTATFTFPSSLILTGTNTLFASQPGLPTDQISTVLIDSYQLNYSNTFTSESNNLFFTYAAAGTHKFTIDGFTMTPVNVFEITNPRAPVRITGITTPTAGTVAFKDIITTSKEYLVIADGAYKIVPTADIKRDSASNLRVTANGADHIVVSHEAFIADAQRLSTLRNGQGLSSVTVDVQDVYDEFGYGITGTAPIRDFLFYAYQNWGASYVVLVGDGHYDPKNNLGTTIKTSFIPPYLAVVEPAPGDFGSANGEIAADNRYVTFPDGFGVVDLMPDMMLGRLAVNSQTEADAIIDKIEAYETQSGTWQTQVLAVADNADSEGNFPPISDRVLTHLPGSYTATKVYMGNTGYETGALVKDAIISNITAGKLLVNYFGHGSYNEWASEQFFKYTDVPSLNNPTTLPVFLNMTCYNGIYIYALTDAVGYDSIAEVLTRTAGEGAVASWASTGLGMASGHEVLDTSFYDAAFNTYGGDTVPLGVTTNAGKLALWATGDNLDLLDSFLLFGDPATGLHVIPNVAPVITGQLPLSITEDTFLVIRLEDLIVTDPDDPYPTKFTLKVSPGENYTFEQNIITPNPDFFGTLTVLVKVNDGHDDSNTFNLTVTVNPINDAPVAMDDTYEAVKDTPLVLSTSTLMANDIDVDNTNEQLNVTAVSSPTNGTVALQNNNVTFMPSIGFTGVAGFDYTISDGTLTDVGHVTVNVSIPKLSQTITVTTHAPELAANGDIFAVAATASSGLPVTYSSGNLSVCTNVGPTFTMVSSTGICPVKYEQAGNDAYYPAPLVVENVNTLLTHSITLVQGWNLVSFNLVPVSTVPEDVFESIEGNYDLVYAWDATVTDGEWLTYFPQVGYGQTLTSIDHSMGFWIHMTSADTLEVVGTPPVTTTISLHTEANGWNLVGFPSVSTLPLPGAMGTTVYSLIYAYPDSTQGWLWFDPTAPIYANKLISLVPGLGYWIKTNTEGPWNVGY